jgi:hypothetical protein
MVQTGMSPGPQTTRLITLLSEAESLLTQHDEAAWATNIRRCRAALEASDAWGLECFLGLLGGMGSLNDVYLARDGQPLNEETDQLQRLLSAAWTLATALKRANEAHT